MRVFYITLIIIIGTVGLPKTAHSYWIWTPESKKWINPKYAPKDTPREQYDWAMQFYLAKIYPRAISEFKKLIKVYPHSELAPDAQYYIGRSYEDMGKYYKAYLAYQKVIDTYPRTELTDEIIERQFRIANLYYSGKKEKLFGLAIIPAIDKAMEIYQKVIENAPYGKYADLAQFKIGECYKKNRQFKEAAEAFQKLINDYPKSLLIEQAKYEAAYCTYKMSLRPNYDQKPTEEAIKEFERFVKEKAEGDLKVEADEVLIRLQEKKAQSLFNTAHFYERTRHYKSAIVYYQEIIDKYPKTTVAPKAFERIAVLEKKIKAKKLAR